MKNYHSQLAIGAGANDLFIRLGFCPDIVRVTEFGTGLGATWFRGQGNDASITRVAAGDRTVNTDKGVKLVCFDDVPLSQSSDPVEVEAGEWYKANGIQLTSDIGVLTDGALLLVESWRLSLPFVRTVHDGGDNKNTYFQDSSIDFKDAGISGGQQFILINQSNDNYAYVKSVERPAGQGKHCRLNLSDAAGNATAAADIDDNDIAYVLPKDSVQYPMSDIGIMT
jgi:hypothetical protein